MLSSHCTSNSRSATPLSAEEESQEDYPNVKFWNKDQWVAYVGANKTTVTDPTTDTKAHSAPFIEDEHGKPVSPAQLRLIRAEGRRIWEMLDQNGEAPSQWGKASSTVVKAYRSEMRKAFRELRLCSNDWKSEQLATMAYPSWYQNRKKNVKKEADLSLSDTESTTKKKKKVKRSSDEVRGHEDSREKKHTKRQKTDSRLHNAEGDHDNVEMVNSRDGGHVTELIHDLDASDQVSGSQRPLTRREDQPEGERAGSSTLGKSAGLSSWVRHLSMLCLHIIMSNPLY